MANNYETATVTPDLPSKFISAFAEVYLKGFGFDLEADGEGDYFFAENGVSYEFVDDGRFDLAVSHVLNHAEQGCPVAMAVAAGLPKSAGHDTFLQDYPSQVSWPEVFQLLLEPCGLGEIVVEAAMWCDKVRPGQFGGWVVRITPDKIQQSGTGQLVADWRKEDSA